MSTESKAILLAKIANILAGKSFITYNNTPIHIHKFKNMSSIPILQYDNLTKHKHYNGFKMSPTTIARNATSDGYCSSAIV